MLSMNPRSFGRAALAAAALGVAAGAAVAAGPTLTYEVVDGVSIPDPLEGKTGDAARGRTAFLENAEAGCAACHTLGGVTGPGAGRAAGAGPALDGVGLRLSQGALRLWIANPEARAEGAGAHAFYSVSAGLPEGAPPRAAPRLGAQTIEDLVAFLDELGRAAE